MPDIKPSVRDRVEIPTSLPPNNSPVMLVGEITLVGTGLNATAKVRVTATPYPLHLEFPLANIEWHSTRGLWLHRPPEPRRTAEPPIREAAE